ncbi:MAG: hypothetical protein OXF27_00355 [Acidobacteria bacterium]|nr:hypothetical protein [Acidobacteriota bacterium]
MLHLARRSWLYECPKPGSSRSEHEVARLPLIDPRVDEVALLVHLRIRFGDVGLIRLRGHIAKGGYDVHDGSYRDAA